MRRFSSLKRFLRNKKAISGIETAIVLIAFIIIASAFAYAVMNMGFLATQKSQQVVLGGLQAASSALVVDGPVYGYAGTTTGANAQLATIIFWLKTAQGGVDMSPTKTTISFQNPRGVWSNIYFCSDGTDNAINTADCPGVSSDDVTSGQAQYFQVNGEYFYAGLGATTLYWETGSGMLLTANGKVRVTIDLSKIGVSATQPSGPGTDTNNNGGPSGLINKDEEFIIIIKPPTGPLLNIDRVAPGAVATVNNLG
jgi:flagellin-like protein